MNYSFPLKTVCSISVIVLSLSNVAAQEREAIVQLLPSPASANSQLSRVESDEAGNVYLSWVSEENDIATFSYATLAGNNWNNPIVISESSNWFINWSDFPMLSVANGNMASHWLKMSAEGTYDYDVEASFFNAKNRKWSQPRILHTDGVNAEHGFVSMTPVNEDSVLITWLDGRDTRNSGAELNQMTIRAGVYSYDGQTLDEWELDSRVCDCCQTDSAMTSKGPIVVYRDRSEQEIRDISYVRYIDGSWSEPRLIHADNWQIAGCPVNGPTVAAQGDRVAVAWFTAKDDLTKVQLALSNDGGDNFSAPILVASDHTIGRLGSTMLGSGEVAVSWVDIEGPEARVMVSLYSEDGRLLNETAVANTSASRRSGFPVIESVEETVYVSWTDVSAGPQVRVARITY